MKIDGFNGKFQQSGGGVITAAAPEEVTRVENTVKKPVYKPDNIHSFNLKKALEETKEVAKELPDEQHTSADDNRVKAQSEFSAADVSAALDAYIASLGEDKTVRIALSSHIPKVDGFVITLEVDNDFLLTKVVDLHSALLSFLMKKLNNGFITLNEQIYVEKNDGEEKKRLFTAKDKFEHFATINPAVGELKALFGLEIE